MAIVQLKDVVVQRVNSKGFGVKVLEENESGGKTYKVYYSVWFKEPHGLSEGDKVSLSGFLGAKIGDPWTDRDGNQRQSVELSLNSPRINGGAIEAEQTVAPVSEPDTWSGGAQYDQSMPF